MDYGKDISEIGRAYQEADRDLRIRHSKVWCVLALVLMPAGVSLDYFVYPHLVEPILKIRLLCDVGVGAILVLLYTPFGRRHIRVLGICWALLPSLAMAWMIFISEGAVSPYYAGLNLVMITVCLLMPWTLGEVLITCALTITLYILACLLHRGTSVSWNILFNNLYFLVLTAIICVVTSIYTARRRFEEFRLRFELDIRNQELARSYEQLEELDRLKSEFFANVSHELRTPLTLILAPIQDILHLRKRLPPKVRDALNIARENSLRLVKLINDLLEIVRFEEGNVKLKRRPINLASFVPGLVDSVRHLARVKDLVMKTQGEGGDLIIQGDPDRLEKGLLNLLMNAIKFTPSGGSVTTRWLRKDSQAVVEVQDSGIGIHKDDLPHIFERFRQADGSSTRRFQGLGIGLSLAKALVEEHGGHVSARSEVGEGTTLRVELPLTSSPVGAQETLRDEHAEKDPITEVYHTADRAAAVKSDDYPADLPAVGAGKFTILIVEDEPDMRRFLISTLAAEHRVLQAVDGEAGLAMARKHLPDLVLLDLMLPGIDGLEVCRAIKGNEEMRSIKVLILTARMDEQSKITALECEANDFLTKPFSTTEVKVRLANLLRAAELEEDLRKRNVELEDTLARLKETEAQLIQSEKMGALGNLAAGLLHEINNPLNFTLTALQVARDEMGDSDSEIRETLDDIGNGMARIRDIVSDLKAFAHPASESERQPFELTEALQTALHLVAHELKDLSLASDIEADCQVLGSKTQITHVFMNLLVNSARALRRIPPDRRPELRISTHTEKGRLQVRVWDNGVGIKPSDLQKVFDPFFTTLDVGEGMGLGLSICHTIVRNHGGTIAINSEEGEWTEVTFDLPLADKEG